MVEEGNKKKKKKKKKKKEDLIQTFEIKEMQMKQTNNPLIFLPFF